MAYDTWESACCFPKDPVPDPSALHGLGPWNRVLVHLLLWLQGRSDLRVSGKLPDTLSVIGTADHANTGLIVQHQRRDLPFSSGSCHGNVLFCAMGQGTVLKELGALSQPSRDTHSPAPAASLPYLMLGQETRGTSSYMCVL